jgi:MSHA biogenesis protein MshP
MAGFSAIAALAILVILGVLGAYVARVSTLQHQGSAMDVLGTRALQAARAGIEWGTYSVLNPEDTSSATPYACPGGGTNISGLAANLAAFTVTVTCSMTGPETEFGNDIRTYQLTATARNMPAGGACPNNASTSAGYVERQLTALIATCRLGAAPCG